jgi:intracellular sulfur oxidation DsrE/DsrF family protein
MSGQMQHRRGFLASLTGALALLPATTAFARGERMAEKDEWLRGLTGKHRQFFDVGSIQAGTPLRRVHNFLATYASAYDISESDVNAVFGAHGPALAFTLGDAAWAKYELGALYAINDPVTEKPATRNIFFEMTSKIGNVPAEASIARLQARGVRFLACNNTLNGLSEQLANARKMEIAAVRHDLVEAVIRGVTVVPAMSIAGNRAQEAGLTYAAIG